MQPVKKRQRRSKAKRRSKSTSSRRTVTRREYAELVVRLGSVELQAQRTRTTLDLHAQRISQMQEELRLLHASAARRATDLPGIAIPPSAATVES